MSIQDVETLTESEIEILVETISVSIQTVGQTSIGGAILVTVSLAKVLEKISALNSAVLKAQAYAPVEAHSGE